MWSVKVFNSGAVLKGESVKEAADLCELIVHPFVPRDAVLVSALHHEGSRRDERRHFRIVKVAGKIPLPDFVLGSEHVTLWKIGANALADPLVKVATAYA